MGSTLPDKPQFKYRNIIQSVVVNNVVCKAAILCETKRISLYATVSSKEMLSDLDIELKEVEMSVYYLELMILDQDGNVAKSAQWMISPNTSTVRNAWRDLKPYLPQHMSDIQGILEDLGYPDPKEFDKEYQIIVSRQARRMGILKYNDDIYKGKASVKIKDIDQIRELTAAALEQE